MTTTRTPRSTLVTLGFAVPAALVVLLLVILLARWLRDLEAVHSFIADYPGHTEVAEGTPVGFPAWMAWQHFFNAFFIVMIIRTGWLVRTTTRTKVFWQRHNSGPIRTKGAPTKISLDLWLHLTVDALWVLNGVTFIAMLFATGQWKRIVPTSLEVFPNAVSAGLQYASLNWPTENGWTNYNSLQVLAYFVTVFIAAPLAIATGLRMSGAWPKNATKLNRIYPVEGARAVHFPVMLYFVLFIVTHVTLVMATGALRNLNHMYAGRDDNSWVGFWFFAGSLAVMVLAVVLARPLILRPIAALTGKVSR